MKVLFFLSACILSTARSERLGLKGLLKACPKEAIKCAVPNFSADIDKDKLRGGLECMKAIDVSTVSATCAAGLAQMQQNGKMGSPGTGTPDVARVNTACPDQISQCGIKTEGGPLKPSDMQCLLATNLTEVSRPCAVVLKHLAFLEVFKLCASEATACQGKYREKLACLKEIDVSTASKECTDALQLAKSRVRVKKQKHVGGGSLQKRCPKETEACGFPASGRLVKGEAKEKLACLREVDITKVSEDCAKALTFLGRKREAVGEGEPKAKGKGKKGKGRQRSAADSAQVIGSHTKYGKANPNRAMGKANLLELRKTNS